MNNEQSNAAPGVAEPAERATAGAPREPWSAPVLAIIRTPTAAFGAGAGADASNFTSAS